MADSAIKDTVQQAEKFWVVPELCIACDACCQDFPEVFYMGDDAKAHAHETHPWDLYNARTVVDVCPTGAIEFSGELPPAEDLSKLEEVPGWEPFRRPRLSTPWNVFTTSCIFPSQPS